MLQGKELLIEDDDDAKSVKFVKARPSRLFKHELEALKNKFDLITLNGYDIRRLCRLQKCCSDLEPEEKPFVDAYHHEVGDSIKL